MAERKKWSKFGLSASDPLGPVSDTTSVGENIIFRPSANWKQEAKDESKDPNAQSMKDKLKDKKVKCRICNGEHFTARCPYKETMAPVGEAGTADVAAGMGDDASAAEAAATGGAGAGKKGSYVPPALRKGAGGGEGERMGGKFSDRDDLATLRVTNVCCISTTILISIAGAAADFLSHPPRRFPRWQRSRSSATCSSGSAASPVSSWPRTGTRAAPRASPSSALRTGPTPSGPVARWTGMVSSILFSRSSLPRRLLLRWCNSVSFRWEKKGLDWTCAAGFRLEGVWGMALHCLVINRLRL